MVTVCAWCQRYLGPKDPVAEPVTHGICAPCSQRQSWSDSPVLVMSPGRSHLLPLFQDLLRGFPEVQVVVERRSNDRRRVAADPPTVERRRVPDRRRGPDLRLS